MTTQEFSDIFSICKKIDSLKYLTNRDRLPVVIAFYDGKSRSCYRIDEVYDISEEINSNIGRILDRAEEEVKQYLTQELKTLEDRFSKIKLINE